MTTNLIQTLTENRKAVYDQAKAIAEAAADENRAFTGDEQSRFNDLNGQLDALDERIRGLKATEAREAATEAKFAEIEARGVDRRYAPKAVGDDDLEDRFRAAALNGDNRPIVVRSANPRSGYQPGVEQRDLTKSTASVFPVSFHDQIVENMVETSAVLRAGATLITTDSGEDMRVPKSTSLSTAALVAEAGTIGESDPGLGVTTLGAFKYAVIVEVSRELVEDAGFDLQGYLARETGTALGNALGDHLINGTGTGQPTGVLTSATVGVTGPTGATGGFGSQANADEGTDLLIDLQSSLAEPYTRSPSAGWLLRNATLGALRKLKTSQGDTAGVDVIEPGTGGASANILGHPAWVDPFVPAVALDAESIIYGDWSKYFVRMVNGVRFERSDHHKWNQDLVSFRAIIRADGALVDTTGALKTFVGAAT